VQVKSGLPSATLRNCVNYFYCSHSEAGREEKQSVIDKFRFVISKGGGCGALVMLEISLSGVQLLVVN
jgi:hypothetical protein